MENKNPNDEKFINEMNEILKKDEFGLYVNSPNYKKIRESIDEAKKKWKKCT